MRIARWKPPVAPTRQEQFLLKRLDRVRKLLGFLRWHRHELFDEAFQDELASMYRSTGDQLMPGGQDRLGDYASTREPRVIITESRVAVSRAPRMLEGSRQGSSRCRWHRCQPDRM